MILRFVARSFRITTAVSAALIIALVLAQAYVAQWRLPLAIVIVAVLAFFFYRTVRHVEERRQRFAAMFNNTSELMVIYDLQGRIIRGNPAVIQRMGFGLETIGKSYMVHIAQEYRSIAEANFARALNGHTVEFEADFLDARGRKVPVIGNLSPITTDGIVTGILGSARDMTEQREVEDELQRGSERFRSLFERSSHAIGAIDTNGMITQVNVALEQLTGYRPEELLGKSSLVLVPESGRARAQSRIDSLVAHANSNFEGVIRTKSGQDIAVEVDVSPIRVLDTLEGYYFRFKDMTRDLAVQRAITQKDERMRLLYRVAATTHSPDAQIVEALVLGSQAMGMGYGFIAKFNDGAFEVVHRHGPEGLFPVGFKKPLTQSIGMRLGESARAMAMDDLRTEPYASELIQHNIPWKSYIGSRITVDGETYGALLFTDPDVRPLKFDDADLDFIDLMASIVGGALARSEHDRDLQKQAFYDNLTGAVNRRLLEEHVAKAIARSRRLSHTLALHYVDLNRFKPINDEYGHDAGDEVLCEVVRRLIGVVRDHDVVARLGGDEFVVMQADIASDEAVRIVASRLHDAFITPMKLSTGVEVRVGCSIGTATFPRDGKTLVELLKSADTAMYVEKRRSTPPVRGA